MEKITRSRQIFKILSIFFLITSILSASIFFSLLISEKESVDRFFDRHNIAKVPIYAPTRDGSHISCIVYTDRNIISRTDHSIPAIIFIPGADNPKNNLFDIKFQFLKFGYSVVAMEQRGHGESGGFFTLYEKECTDVSDVITYLENNFPQLNTSNMGLVGMSLGGGAAIGAQAIDDRIHASVIYHPAANLSDLFRTMELHPFDYFGYLPGMTQPSFFSFGFPDWNRIRDETWSQMHDTINLMNETNTKNLLLLHGANDDMILPSVSQTIHDRADPNNNRDDVQFVLRSNLGHGANERDYGSLKYTLAWFNHFYKNISINLSNLESEIDNISFFKFDFPKKGEYESWLILMVILFIAFLYCSVFGLLYPQKTEFNKDQIRASWIGPNDPNFENKFKNTLIIRSIALIAIYLISSLYARMNNPSILNAFLIHPAFLAIPILLLLPIGSYKKEHFRKEYVAQLNQNLKKWFSKESILSFLLSYAMFGLPLLILLGFINLGGIYTISGIYNPGFAIGLMNVLTFGLIFCIPCLLLHDLPRKYSFYSILVIFIGIFVGTLLLPIKPLPMLPFNAIGLLLALAVSLIQFIFYGLLLAIRKWFTKNIPAMLLALGTLISVIMWIRFMRVV